MIKEACCGDAPTGIAPSGEKREITIREVNNGFIVRVGCQTFVFETREKMLGELERYLKDREGVEKEYLSKK